VPLPISGDGEPYCIAISIRFDPSVQRHILLSYMGSSSRGLFWRGFSSGSQQAKAEWMMMRNAIRTARPLRPRAREVSPANEVKLKDRIASHPIEIK
jgi:hypothetical protein